MIHLCDSVTIFFRLSFYVTKSKNAIGNEWNRCLCVLMIDTWPNELSRLSFCRLFIWRRKKNSFNEKIKINRCVLCVSICWLKKKWNFSFHLKSVYHVDWTRVKQLVSWNKRCDTSHLNGPNKSVSVHNRLKVRSVFISIFMYRFYLSAARALSLSSCFFHLSKASQNIAIICLR